MKTPHNPVLLALVLVGAAALVLGSFVSHGPNRLVSGLPFSLWRLAGSAELAAIIALGAVLLAASVAAPRRWIAAAVAVVAALLLLLLLGEAGEAAREFASHAPRAARTALGPAFWVASIAAALAVLDGLQRLAAGPLTRLAVVAAIAMAIAALVATGRLDELSLMREFATRREAFFGELARHGVLVLGAVVPALVIGMPLGLAAARHPGAQGSLFATLNAIQAIPSVALFGLLIAPLAALAASFPALASLGIHGIGRAPAIVALVLYSLLPVVRNTQAGILAVDPALIDSAAGMGMTSRQIFWRIELPLGMPVFLAGLRIVTVQAIGLAAVAALIGAGGLGTFVFQGIGQYAIDLVLLGAVPIVFLALAADFALALVIDGLKRRRG